MLYTFPDYYKEFHCIADKCQATCCAGWQIVIDPKALYRYKKEKGDFGKRLRSSINWKEGTFKQSTDKRCVFLNEKNLCDMCLALGEESFCKTCARYPRHMEEFENVREITLSVSCPEVARILLDKKEPVTFLSYEREGEEEYEDYDPFLYSLLVDAREVMREILQDRKLPIQVRSKLILGLAHDMQVREQRGERFSGEAVFRKYRKEQAVSFVMQKLKDGRKDKNTCYTYSRSLYRKLYQLEKLFDEWEYHLQETEELLYGEGTAEYEKLHREFARWLKENMPEWEIGCEQLYVYFIYTYFCGAVYDGRIYSKVQMAAASVRLIYEMLAARWKKNGGMLDREDVVRMVYRYSRELEHSDPNLELMEKLMKEFRKSMLAF